MNAVTGWALLCALGGLLLLLPAFMRASPAKIAFLLRMVLTVVAALGGIVLLVMGRLGLALAVAGAAMMAFGALKRMNTGVGGGSTANAGRNSVVETESLRMELDHTTGALDGEIRRGRWKGKRLDNLGVLQVVDLLDDCRRHDPPSVALLETYLDRRQPDWRGSDQADHEAGEEAWSRATTQGAMDAATAYAVLGLDEGADEPAIRRAHREMMARYHPDRGGSNFLAAQINEAKDVLLRLRRT